ncbi:MULTISPECIES: GntR family transcriptional regulator [Bacteroides]|uniref:GntR family transcriptional regulator n=1 Tax=Bacteroides TaxID=816 RepID=UPI000C77A4B2|nr:MULTISPECIES: GntR family transcriptional regulator [Bacteroides]RGM45692.1 GntR family transcriptional regulator [Bacteroides sp. OM08-11]
MEFKTNKPIYQQIVDFCFSKILTHEWRAEERIVSVRELSTLLAVNSRTVLKAYEYLQAEDIIYPERGMGFYLSKDAMKKVMKIQKKEFFDNQLADTFRNMELLGIGIEEIIERYNKLKKTVHEEIR